MNYLDHLLEDENRKALRKELKSEAVGEHNLKTYAKTALTHSMIRLIESTTYCFVGTGSDAGININLKSGPKGFIKVQEGKLYLPDYSGNGILHGLGDLTRNPHIGLLFMDIEKKMRLKLNGKATLIRDEKTLSTLWPNDPEFPNQGLMINVEYALWNCSKSFEWARF